MTKQNKDIMIQITKIDLNLLLNQPVDYCPSEENGGVFCEHDDYSLEVIINRDEIEYEICDIDTRYTSEEVTDWQNEMIVDYVYRFIEQGKQDYKDHLIEERDRLNYNY